MRAPGTDRHSIKDSPAFICVLSTVDACAFLGLANMTYKIRPQDCSTFLATLNTWNFWKFIITCFAKTIFRSISNGIDSSRHKLFAAITPEIWVIFFHESSRPLTGNVRAGPPVIAEKSSTGLGSRFFLCIVLIFPELCTGTFFS